MTTDVEDAAAANTIDRGFDFTDGGESFCDGPTQLPAPWSPPPDPDFQTGMIPRLELADLDEGQVLGLEPSDSLKATTRLSREDVRALVAARMQAMSGEMAAAGSPDSAEVGRRFALASAAAPGRPVAERPVARRPMASPPVAGWPDAGPPVAAPLPPAAMAAIPALPAPGMRVVIAYRWQLYHVAIAFAIGVLTGVLAMR